MDRHYALCFIIELFLLKEGRVYINSEFALIFRGSRERRLISRGETGTESTSTTTTASSYKVSIELQVIFLNRQKKERDLILISQPNREQLSATKFSLVAT